MMKIEMTGMMIMMSMTMIFVRMTADEHDDDEHCAVLHLSLAQPLLRLL